MNYQQKYLKYKKKYLDLKNSKGGAAPSANKKGIVFIFVPVGFEAGWYSDLVHYFELYSKLNYFEDRVYILGPTSLASSQDIINTGLSSPEFMSVTPMEGLLRTESVGMEFGVDRRIGKFDDLGIEQLYKRIEFHKPDIIHFHFLTHGAINGQYINMSDGKIMNVNDIINKLILNEQINIRNRKLLIHTDSCFGGNYILNIKEELSRRGFDLLNIELFLTADTINKNSYNIYRSGITKKSLGWWYENTILSALMGDGNIKFAEMFGNNGMLYNNGGKIMLRYLFQIRFDDIIKKIKDGMSLAYYNHIKVTDIELLSTTFVYLYKNWNTLGEFEKNFMIILCYFPIEFDNFTDKTEEMINISKEFRDSYKTLLANDRVTITLILNYKRDILSGYSIKRIIEEKLEFNNKAKYTQNLLDLFKKVISRENVISYNELTIPEELRLTTTLSSLFGSLKI